MIFFIVNSFLNINGKACIFAPVSTASQKGLPCQILVIGFHYPEASTTLRPHVVSQRQIASFVTDPTLVQMLFVLGVFGFSIVSYSLTIM